MLRTSRMAGLALALTLGLAATACGSDTNSADLGPGKNEASGDPIKVGYINQEGAATGSYPGLREGTEAATRYLNRDLGGVNGRPVELVTCTVNGTPESSQKCANEMVQEGVPVVLSGLDFSGPSGTAVLAAAGIPQVTSSPIQGTDFSGENVFALLGGGPGQLTGLASYVAGDLGAESVTIFVHDDPSGDQTMATFKAALEERGVTDIDVVKELNNAPDFTAGMTAAARNDSDAIALFFTSAACSQTMQAAAALGVDAAMFSTSSCADPSILASAGEAANGVFFAQEVLPFAAHHDNPEVAAFLESMEKYAGIDEPELTAHHANGFSAAMTFYDILSSASTSDSKGIMATFRTAKGTGFMDDDYNCDRTLLPEYPTICNASIRITTMKDGAVTELSDWIQP